MITITENIVRKVLTTVDAGLVMGLGKPVLGKMCVEAAVCFALDLPHSDDPVCVSPALRQLKITLNDLRWSSNEARAKGLRRLAVIQLGTKDVLDEKEFVRRLIDYAIRVSIPSALRKAAAINNEEQYKVKLIEAANRCEKEGTQSAVWAAADVADAVADVGDFQSRLADDAADAADTAAAAAVDAAVRAAAAVASLDANTAASWVVLAAAGDANTAARVIGNNDKSLSEYAEVVVQILIDMKAPSSQWLWLTEL